MSSLRILIVEDEPLIAMDLEFTISDVIPASIIIKSSVAGTMAVLEHPLDFAFLDVKVVDGETTPFAAILIEQNIPFAFVSATPPHELPVALRGSPFIHKPASRHLIAALLRDHFDVV